MPAKTKRNAGNICTSTKSTKPQHPLSQSQAVRRSRRQVAPKKINSKASKMNVRVPKGTQIKFSKYDTHHPIENKMGLTELWQTCNEKKDAEVAFFKDLSMGKAELYARTKRQRGLVALGKYLSAVRIQGWYRRISNLEIRNFSSSKENTNVTIRAKKHAAQHAVPEHHFNGADDPVSSVLGALSTLDLNRSSVPHGV